MKRLSRLFFICAFFLLPSVAGTVTDDKIGFTIPLPDNWVCFNRTDTSAVFEDTTGRYRAVIGIYYENFADETLFTQPDEWTRAKFISYELTIDADPLCALVFFDTMSIRQNGAYWAPEAYAYYFEIDTSVGDWAEYIRFTAVGTSGYELYAIGPLPDLDSNIAYYAAIIDGFTLHDPDNPVIKPPRGRFAPQAASLKYSPYRLDLLGRRFNGRPDHQSAPQLIIRQRNKSCFLR